MYLRFAIEKRNVDSGRGIGIFHAAVNLRSSSALEQWEYEVLCELLHWFDQNLEKPDRFTASKPPYYRKQPKAISWFKDTAIEHIDRTRQMVVILERHGLTVQTHRAERVGYVVYEDEFQVVAEPFSDVVC